ncbi:efflux transporter outer membrane subunit [Vibrio cincinnatiensis]|uniref:efflux transporter outer membrane subunit n=1 Tax=Vibrio cincinnatiensis TaxID=675 RepID=UPI001EDECF7C|nr:efflux transporter outer membrane subunit [Vibrio cincinnatiensis]MCG3729085.1 efflux transporter outer membrane subunit [Vibrio cincinnatiensis]
MLPSSQYSSLALSMLLLFGCSTQYEAVEPSVFIAADWHTPQQETSKLWESQWWKSFQDPKLNQLVERVLSSNHDLAQATLTLKQARLNADLDMDQRIPDLSAGASGSRSKDLNHGETSKNYQAKISISYELDLWGKLSATIDESQWSALATQQEREATAQSLVATTAQLYWQIGYLKQRISLSQQDIDNAVQTLSLAQSQYAHGATSRLTVLEAKRSLAGLEAAHRDYQQQYRQASNALAILFEQTPDQTDIEIDQLPDQDLPSISAGIPAEVLGRRPDVKQALYQLQASLAAKESTRRSYFPALTLTGALGGSSTELKKLLSDPIGTLGADLTLPFLNWNEMQLKRDIAQVQYESAVITYRKTLYAAFQDVDNALSARENYQYQAEKLAQQWQSAAEATRIYQSQYQHGAIEIKTLLDAQENERNARAALLENHYQQLVTLSTLYRSLGGEVILSEAGS